jgi:3-hydroxybutyryl-CoA dehydrogenase
MPFLKEIKNITVIGAGQMGHGIAQAFAEAGYHVRLYDTSLERLESGLSRIRENLDILISNKLTIPEEAIAILGRIQGFTELKAAVKGSDFIEEAIFENLELKQKLYERLESIVSLDTIIASNTSGMMPTDLSAKMTHPDRFLVAHFWKPPHLVNLVELVAGEKTDPHILDNVYQLLELINKKPIIVKREIPGFIGNRIQYAIAREAMHMVDQGIASPEDIDLAIVEGFGIRFSFAGIFKIIDLMGLDLAASIWKWVLPMDHRGVD